MNITAQLDYQTILANKAVPIHFALRLQAPELTEARPKPAAFCVVLDRSGSMQGVPLQRAREATQVAIRNLRPEDLFALVVFDDIARAVIPLQPARDKQHLLRAVEQVHSGGSTNLTGGWMLGRDELAKAPAGTTRRALLLSDGQLNVGIVEPAQVRGIVANGLEQAGIRTSCLGFGNNYNETLMADLASATGGVFYDASSPDKFPAIFSSELEGLQKLAIQNIRLRIKQLDFCESYAPLGEDPWITLPDGRQEFAVGDLVSGEERVIVFALSVLPLPAIGGQPVATLEGEQLLEFELAYDELSKEGISSKTYTQVLRVQSTQDAAKVAVNAEVISWIALQRAGSAMRSAIEHHDSGDGIVAYSKLSDCAAGLRSYGPAATEALQHLDEMAGQIQKSEFDDRARKMARYRSSSYRRMSSRDHWTGAGPAPSFKQAPPPPSPPNNPEPPKQEPPPAGGQNAS